MRTCPDCRFAAPASSIADRFDCRRRAPALLRIGPSEMRVYPQVDRGDWCGEFEESDDAQRARQDAAWRAQCRDWADQERRDRERDAEWCARHPILARLRRWGFR